MNSPEQQYREASPPEPGDLIGKWKITVLSGRMPNMRRYGHVKVIKIKNGQLSGYNRILRFINLAKFTVIFRKTGAMFCYDAPFYDLVRKVDDDLLIGKYVLVRDSGMGDVTGYFEMRRA